MHAVPKLTRAFLITKKGQPMSDNLLNQFCLWQASQTASSLIALKIQGTTERLCSIVIMLSRNVMLTAICNNSSPNLNQLAQSYQGSQMGQHSRLPILPVHWDRNILQHTGRCRKGAGWNHISSGRMIHRFGRLSHWCMLAPALVLYNYVCKWKYNNIVAINLLYM